MVKGGAFPELVRSVTVDADVCRAHSEVDYVALCPAEVISHGDAVTNHNGDVTVDEAGCFHCTRLHGERPGRRLYRGQAISGARFSRYRPLPGGLPGLRRRLPLRTPSPTTAKR